MTLGRCWADATMAAEPIQSGESSSSLSEPSKEYSILGSCQDKNSSTGEPDGSLPGSCRCASPIDPSKATYNLCHKGTYSMTTCPKHTCDRDASSLANYRGVHLCPSACVSCRTVELFVAAPGLSCRCTRSQDASFSASSWTRIGHARATVIRFVPCM